MLAERSVSAPIRERTNVQTDPHHIVVWGVAKLLLPHNAAIVCAYTHPSRNDPKGGIYSIRSDALV